MHPLHAVLLGALEGFTEFLPISSTGHLILASRWLGLSGAAVDTFAVVIQAGALVAVLGLYRHRLASRTLLRNLAISFLPAAVAGALLHRAIKARLFGTGPVVIALAAGGALMIAAGPWLRRRRGTAALETLSPGGALAIGMAQCLALWPGTSRAMVTMLAGVAAGLPLPAAVEYSFLLALPTLGAATVLDLAAGGSTLLHDVGAAAVALGFVTAALVAAAAIRRFIPFVTRRGLAPFGWYRLGLAAAVGWWVR